MKCIYTIGHSTRPVLEFIDILKHYGVTLLMDIRTVPRSRHMPDYNLETLPRLLADVGIAHTYEAALGGLRKPHADSINGGWRNKSFRGYADYMQTDEFRAGIERLIAHAKEHTVAIMCAEAVPWRCHRSLVGDALLVRGRCVMDIFDATHTKEEVLTPFAQVVGTTITYPPYE